MYLVQFPSGAGLRSGSIIAKYKRPDWAGRLYR
jgi:hypothetical protein